MIRGVEERGKVTERLTGVVRCQDMVHLIFCFY